MENISSKYDPKEVEERWYQLWESKGYFKTSPESPKPAFSIVIPPPNVTGSLHIGHALNNTLQDLLIRYKRMNGFEALWVPGCDHAGIATQNVVERELAKEGKRRDDLGRDKFVGRVWQWKEQSGATIMKQLRRLGASCDWSYERFTMDAGLSQAVVEAFISLFEQGLIYQGDYIINWCPRCGTALSDIEAEHKETQGKLYHVRYAVKGKPGSFITVATTRPETIMGDVAVCVHPEDKRYLAFHGATLILPVLGKEIPLVTDSYVDPSFGTGALKITPAHDANDFAIGDKYKLPRVKIMDPQGVMNELAGPYRGLDRFECRKRIVADLETEGLLAKVEDYTHGVARCYRCNTVVESYLSKQWFVAMKPLAELAKKAVQDGRTKFVPENWTKVYTDWLDNIRDWCISRQIWWGHRIPVYHHADGRKVAAHSLQEAARKMGVPEASLSQDPDVLDTWFSSGLWPFSTLGWPSQSKELQRYYPTSVLVTSWDILFFWVARMSMFGLKLVGQVPFKEVLINSLVADEHGQKMSKSKGNVIDPLTKIDSIGADALRFALCSIETQSRYISLSEEKMESARNFMNKIWNAARFMLMNLEGLPKDQVLELPKIESLDLVDQWILERLFATAQEVNQALEAGRYQVARMAAAILDFFWKELCDWYIEAAKVRLQADGPARRQAQEVLAFVLENTMRLLHPLCPFITEEIWQHLPHQGPSLMLASWPQLPRPEGRAQQRFNVAQQVVYEIRKLRGEMKVDLAKVVTAFVQVQDADAEQILRSQQGVVEALAKVKIAGLGSSQQKPKGSAAVVAGPVQVFLPLEELLDLRAESQRLNKEIEQQRAYQASLEKKLENPQFVSKAPAWVVAVEKEKIERVKETIAKLESNLRELSSL